MNTWKIDQAHSRIEFKVKHLVVTTLGGHFNKFDATAESDSDDLSDAKISFEADVDSISTNNEQRDGHLKSDVFFDTAKYPKLKFVSTSLKKTDAENYKLSGNLTIRDKTLPVTLDVAYGGTAKNFQSKTVVGFELTGKINRKDFGLVWSATTETGNIVLGDEIRLAISVEMVKQD